MIKEIALNGVTTTPDDYLCKDGDLSYCSDLIHEDGSIKPAPVPTEIFTLPTGYELMHIHRQTGYANWIIFDGSNVNNPRLKYVAEANLTAQQVTYTTLPLTLNAKPLQITSIGNDLVILTNEGVRHFLYKDGDYTLLPLRMPSLRHSFGLVGTYVNKLHNQAVFISENGSQLIYENRVAEKYYLGVNFGESPYSYPLDKVSPSTVDTPGWYCLEITIQNSQGTYGWGLEGYDSNDNVVYNNYIKSSGLRAVQTAATSTFYVDVNVAQWKFYVLKEASEKTFARVSLTKSNGTGRLAIDNGSEHNSCSVLNGAAKKFIQEEALNRRRFIMPFFARIALRLVNNSYVNLSAPCLMIPNSGKVPYVDTTMDGFGTGAFRQRFVYVYVSALCCELQLQLPDVSVLRPWRDFVKDIVVAVSQPIYQVNLNVENEEDQNREFSIEELPSSIADDISVAALATSATSPLSPNQNYPHFMRKNSVIYSNLVGGTRSNYIIRYPSIKNQREEFERSSKFYIIKSIDVEELLANNEYATMKTLDLSDIDLNNLQNYTELPEDYSSLNDYVPNLALAYNSRLHIADYTQKGFCGYDPTDMNGYVSIDGTANRQRFYAEVRITDNHQTYKVTSMMQEFTRGYLHYFFFPNITAKEAVIYRDPVGDTGTHAYQKTVLKLRQHPYMNGAYWFDDFKEPTWTTIPIPNSPGSTQESNEEWYHVNLLQHGVYASIPKRNFIKLSELNNPFTFTDNRTYPFDSRVVTLSPITTALSTGQVGQFDLYVFTEQSGVWSLKIGEDGGYTNQIPVTRDTILSAKSLAQIDKAVLFTSKRGMMMLQGSESECVSEALNSLQKVELKDTVLPSITTLLNGSTAEITYNFRSYMNNARIAYDYTNQRIVVFNPDYTYCYALSLRSQHWTILHMQLKYAVNSYPDAYVVNNANKVINLSEHNANGTIPDGIIVTRPFSLDSSNDFKLIDHIRQNGFIRFMTEEVGQNPAPNATKLNQILYGSNDLQHWYLCASSVNGYIADKNGKHAGQYRFFRLAIKVKLAVDETLDSFTISYRVKEDNNKLM